MIVLKNRIYTTYVVLYFVVCFASNSMLRAFNIASSILRKKIIVWKHTMYLNNPLLLDIYAINNFY